MRVLVFGTFDGLHPGHRSFLSQALRRALNHSPHRSKASSGGSGSGRGELFIVVARDVNVKRSKGKLPVQKEAQRRRAVQAAFPDARVLLGELDDRFLPVVTLRPDLVLLGYDQQFPPGIEERDFAEAGIAIERLPPFKPEKYKSSLLRKQKIERRS